MSKGLKKVREELEVYAEFHKLVDEWVNELPRESELGTLACDEKGCAACCWKLVTLSIPEMMYVVFDLLDRSSEKKVDELENRCMEQIRLMDARGFNASDDYADSWFGLKIPCILLDGQRLCRVYEKRPVVCRSFFVFDGEEQCSGPSRSLVKQLDNRAVVQHLIETDIEVCKELRVTASPMPLPAAMRAAIYWWRYGLYELRSWLKKAT